MSPLTCLYLNFQISGHKFTKEGSSKQALLNLTQDQVDGLYKLQN